MSSRIAIVIVNYRTPQLALNAARAVAGERADHPDLQVVIVDGGSGDGSAELLAKGLDDSFFAGWTHLLPLPINGGFGWANNQAIQHLLQGSTPPDYIHLLNPDTAAEAGAVSRLADTLDRYPDCGAVGSLLLEPDGSSAGSAFSFPQVRSELLRGARAGLIARMLRVPPLAFLDAPPREVGWVTGASVMLRAVALKESGLFDTGFFLYFEEVELMWRLARAGWTIRHEPASRVAHVGGAATGVNGSRPAALRPPLPPYWYESRRRFLALTGGRARAAAASLMWLAGHGSLLARRTLGGAKQHAVVERDARTLLTHGIWPNRRDSQPAVAWWSDAPGKSPAWMDER